MKKIGLFGGTFDPVHLGHRAMVLEALALGLEHILVMPCFLSPHKLAGTANSETPASPEDRHRMLQLAFSGMPQVEISRFELDRPEPSYTWRTLEHLRCGHPDSKPVLMIGMDQFYALATWARFLEWYREVEVWVFKRGGIARKEGFAVPPDLSYRLLESEIPAISATDIRQRVQNGQSLAALVDPQVEAYVHEMGLYRLEGTGH